MQAPASLQDESGRIDAPPPAAAMDPNHFPSRLHEMLDTIDDDSSGTANSGKFVSWQPHGKCFLIKNKEEFIAKVLPRWFCRLKFTTFERQLHKHGFRKLSRKGPDQGAYYHPRFARDTPELAGSIHHTNIKGKRGRKPKAKETEPDFYSKDGGSQAVSAALQEEVKSRSSPLQSQETKSTRSSTTGRSSTGNTGWSARYSEAKMGETKMGEYFPRDTLLSSTLHRDPQARLTQSHVQRDLRWQPTEGMQTLGIQQAQSLLSPVGQHADSRASLGGAPFQSQLSGHAYQHQPQSGQFPSSLQAESILPAPQFARQPSDYSIGAVSIFGALGDSPPDDLASSFTAIEENQVRRLQLQSGPQPPLNDHQERLNDILYRNQQQQMNLQRQQQQLEQQRFELQLTEQQNLDISGQHFFQQHRQHPHSSPSASLLFREQQLQQYQNELQQQMLTSNLQQQQQQELLFSRQGLPPQQPPDQQNSYQNNRML